MKMSSFCALALMCVGASQAFAQIQIVGSRKPTPAPRLVSDQSLDGALGEIGESDSNLLDGAPTVPNPFDYFSDEPATDSLPMQTQDPVGGFSETDQRQSQVSQQTANPNNRTSSDVERRSPFGAESVRSDETQDPSSLPVNLPNRSVVDTIVDEAALASIAHVRMTPVFWGGAPQTPNPIAQWLTREECVEGLWNGYQQQRQLECVNMWHNLQHHGCGCGGCGACGTCAASGPCAVCKPTKTRNRYTEQLQATSSCDACSQPDETRAASTCDTAALGFHPQPLGPAATVQSARFLPLPPPPAVPTTAQSPAPTQDSKAPARANVASFPSAVYR